MTSLKGALLEIREALMFANSRHGPWEGYEAAITKINTILRIVPEALHEEKFRKGDYWAYECLHILSDITKEKEKSHDEK